MQMLPADLKKVLNAAPKSKATWESLTPVAQRDFLTWIASAKLPETRKRRVESVPSRLASGKRRPCCYAVVPTSLYAALNENEEAKANWKTFTADEKRDFSDWIGSAKDSAERAVRTLKATAMIGKGKRHP